MNAYVVAALIAIVIYTVFNLIVGLGLGFDKETVSSARGYFIGGGTRNFILFFTTVATWFSTGIYQGVVGSVYKNGIGWIGISTWQLLVVSLMGILGPRFYTLSKIRNYITPADLVGDYYKSKPFKIIMGLGMLAFCIPSMMAQIRGVSWAINGITDEFIPFQIGVLYAAVIVGIYVYLGGFNSQAWVDTAQGLAFIVILWGSLFIVAWKNGGWNESWSRLMETAPEVLYYKDITEYWNWRMYLSFFVLQGCGGFFAPYVWQRSYAAKSSGAVKKLAGYMGAFFCFGVCFPVVFCGLNFHVLMPEMANPENGLVAFMAQFAPAWGIFVTIGILAAGMSTISSILVTCSSIVAVDLGGIIAPSADSVKVRNWGRKAVIVMLIIGVALSLISLNTIEILINLTLAGFTQILIPVLGIFVFRWITPKGACAGYIAGLIITYLGTVHWNNPFGFMGGMWGLAANIVICVIISMFTEPIKEEERKQFLSPLSKPDKG
ncbi:sodium:solute symporter family protein [Lachnoclostridium edouardi]|uniref:sodium:solute symporter family protein n=1 Tax=Lachnoclostridium edouardi TaxID=1926283 RepID=UPI000C7C1806|nr:sodium:solute symporter family protein [Lachnoclostridium edouardi]